MWSSKICTIIRSQRVPKTWPMPDCHIFLSYFGVFKLAPRSGTGLLQLLRVLPSFLPSFLLCQQFIKYRSVLYDVNQCYQIPILHAAYTSALVSALGTISVSLEEKGGTARSPGSRPPRNTFTVAHRGHAALYFFSRSRVNKLWSRVITRPRPKRPAES